MKKIISGFGVLSAVLVLLSGCLKDKGFENHTYGINDPDTQPPGVGFPRAASAKVGYGLNVSDDNQAVNDIVYVNLETGTPAAADVHVTLVLNDDLITAYNANNGLTGNAAIQILDHSLFSVSLDLVIPKGARNVQVPINVPTTAPLDANLSYGVGFTIASVDGGYTIVDNLKNLLIGFNIKNKYDGIYELKGVHTRSPYLFNFDVNVGMVTSGPTSVAMFMLAPYNDFGQPIGVAPGQINWYGNAVSPNFIFDGATNEAIDMNLQVGTAVTVALVNGPGIHNYYDPATKTMYLCWQYNGNDLRRFYDTLIYVKPR